MKTLLILRHAKSSWKHAELPDHDRPLNDRGKRDAPRMGRLISDQQLRPTLVLSSTAKRARKTATKVVRSSEQLAEIQLCPEFYLADPDTYIGVLRAQDDVGLEVRGGDVEDVRGGHAVS